MLQDYSESKKTYAGGVNSVDWVAGLAQVATGDGVVCAGEVQRARDGTSPGHFLLQGCCYWDHGRGRPGGSAGPCNTALVYAAFNRVLEEVCR